jgi:hypothetical protein
MAGRTPPRDAAASAASLDAKWEFPELRAVIRERRTHGSGPGLAPSTQPRAVSDADKENAEAETPAVFHTPSLVASKVPWRVESQLRRSTCMFIEDMAALMGVPEAPVVTAQLYAQRFYSLHSFATHDRFLLATAALFLAGKAEEFPIKVRLMTECAMFLLLCPSKAQEQLQAAHQRGHKKSPRSGPNTPTHKAQQPRRDSQGKPVEMSASLGNDPKAANAKHIDFMKALLETVEVGEVEIKAKKVLLLERILLQTLSFELSAPQPYAYVLPLLESVLSLDAVHEGIGHRDVREVAYMLLADAIRGGLCLAFDPRTLAAGAVYLSCLYRRQVSPNVTTDSNEPWWTLLGVPARRMEEVANAFLWLFEDPDTGDQLPKLGPDFKDLWKRYRPESNLPDLEMVKKLDAELRQQQEAPAASPPARG